MWRGNRRRNMGVRLEMRKLILLICVVALLSGLVSAVIAAEPGEIAMGGFLLWRIRCASAGYTLEERTDIIQARVNNLLTLGAFDPSMIRIVTSGNDVSIYADQTLVITIDECTARTNHTTPAGLAQVWAERLRVIYPQAAPRPPQMEQPTSAE